MKLLPTLVGASLGAGTRFLNDGLNWENGGEWAAQIDPNLESCPWTNDREYYLE